MVMQKLSRIELLQVLYRARHYLWLRTVNTPTASADQLLAVVDTELTRAFVCPVCEVCQKRIHTGACHV